MTGRGTQSSGASANNGASFSNGNGPQSFWPAQADWQAGYTLRAVSHWELA